MVMDISETRARNGDIKVSAGEGKGKEKIEIVWRPDKKQLVVEYAAAKGWSFNYLAEKILNEHVVAEAKKRRWKNISDVKAILKRLAGKQVLTGYVRGVILQYIDRNPLRELPQVSRTTDLNLLKQTRPDALVYVIPVNGSRIVAAPDGEGGWRGLVFDPTIVGSASTWHSARLNPPVWAKTPTVLKSIAFVASRIDMDGMAYFELPGTNIKISARWSGERFEEGTVIEKGVHQSWLRGGWYSHMHDPKGPFNLRPNVRKALNMLCRTMTVGNGGLTEIVPSN